MTSDPNELRSDSDGAVDGADVERPYEPHYSEPSFETSSRDADWEVPTSAEGGMGEPAESASVPDASPLLEEQVSGTEGDGPGQFWNEGAPVSGATSNSQPIPPQQPMGQQGYGRQGNPQPALGQESAWGSGPQQQPEWGSGAQQQPGRDSGPQQSYQSGPQGGMPPQYAGNTAMGPGSNNPNYLAGPSAQGRSIIMLDYWLSAFFWWIPALIFYLSEKDKNQLMDEHIKELLNFNITRMIVVAIMIIPVIGPILGGIASLAMFVIALMGALKGPDEYANGRTYQFPLTYRFIK